MSASDGHDRFYRGGWSPKLFSTDAQGRLRLHKGLRINEVRSIRNRAELDGRWVWNIFCRPAVGLLKGKLRLRQVTRLCDSP
jgi:hypothetical protein